jgi:glucokinase
MLLAGDLGGTKTLLGLFERNKVGSRPEQVIVQEFPTLDYPSAADILLEFLAETATPASTIEAACLGIPGPVIDQRVKPTNVNWEVDARELKQRLGLERLWLLNDLEAMANGVPVLTKDELRVLQAGKRDPHGNGALLAAGTGLGQAMLIEIAGRWEPSPSEGGHADFAARTPREIELLQELTRRFGRASTESVISGPGFINIARFTSQGRSWVFDKTNDPIELPKIITRAARERTCDHCVEALNLFLGAFGAAAGNFAMHTVATGGVYLGGGIPVKLLWAFDSPLFMEAFLAKQPLDDLMQRIPVSIILNTRAGLLGAAVYANRM